MATCSEYCSEVQRAVLRVCVDSFINPLRTIERSLVGAPFVVPETETAEWTCASTLSVFRVAQ